MTGTVVAAFVSSLLFPFVVTEKWLYYIVCVYVMLCVCVYKTTVSRRDHHTHWKLELQAVVSYPTWVLGTELHCVFMAG